MDEAAVECLDWAWSQEDFYEVAGDVIPVDGGLYCSELTRGTRDGVSYRIGHRAIAHFHTHVHNGWGAAEHFSIPDIEMVVLWDPYRRPSYIRTPTGHVWRFFCRDLGDKVKCELRQLR